MYDELRIQEKILQNELRKDDMVMLNMMESMIGQSSIMSEKTEDLNAKLKEAENRNFNLEQEIRTLKIQLEEEKEAKVDLEIQNIKMRKDLRKLQTSLESVNNNCYDDVNDLNFSDVSDMSEDNNITIIGGDASDFSLLHDLSDFDILSDKTLGRSPFFSTAGTTALLLDSPSPTTPRTVRKCLAPSRSSVKKVSDTYTKKVHNMPPSVTISRTGDTIKKARRRSKSVDFHIGEKTLIVPEVCELCVQKAQRQRGAEDSPTLPWCPHQSHGKDLHAISANVTPIRSMMFKNVLSSGGGKRDARIKATSTPLVKSILKLQPTTTIVNSGPGRVRK